MRTFNEKIIFRYLNRVSLNPNICPEHNEQSPQPILVLCTLTTLLVEPPKRWWLAYIGCSGPAYDRLIP